MERNKSRHLEKEYKSRINKTFDYIESNIEKQFTLEELAVIKFLQIFLNSAIMLYHCMYY